MKITVKNYEVAKALEKALQLPESINILNIGDKFIKYYTDNKDSIMVNIAENGIETFDSELIKQVRAELKLLQIVTPAAPVVKPIDARENALNTLNGTGNYRAANHLNQVIQDTIANLEKCALTLAKKLNALQAETDNEKRAKYAFDILKKQNSCRRTAADLKFNLEGAPRFIANLENDAARFTDNAFVEVATEKINELKATIAQAENYIDVALIALNDVFDFATKVVAEKAIDAATEIETVKYDYSAEIEKMRTAYAIGDLKKRSAALAHIWQRDIAKKAGLGNNAKAGEVKAHFGIDKKATLEEIISALSNSPTNAAEIDAEVANATAPVNEPQNATVATVDAEIANATAPVNEPQNAPVATVDAEIANATAPAVVLFIADVPQNPEYYGITTRTTAKGNTSWFINGNYVREGYATSKLNALIQAAAAKTIEGQIKGYIASIRRCVDRAAFKYNYALNRVAEYSMHVVNSINSARYLANNPFGVEEVDNCRELADTWWYYNNALNELVYLVIEEKGTISRIAEMRDRLNALISEYPQVAAAIKDIGDVNDAAAKFDALQEKINNLPAMLYDNFNLMLQLTNCTPAVDAPAEVPVNAPVLLLPPPKSESIDAAALETNALSKINAYVRDVNAANSRIAMHCRARRIDNAVAAVKAAALQIGLKSARDMQWILDGLNTLIAPIEEAAQQLDCDENAISYTLNRGYSLSTLDNVTYANSLFMYNKLYSDFNGTVKFYSLLNIYGELRLAAEVVSNNEIDAAISEFENFAPPVDLALAEIADYYFTHAADNAPTSPTTPSNEPIDTNPSTGNEPPATSPTAPDSLIKQIGSNHAAAITAILAANQTPVANLLAAYLGKVKFNNSNGVGRKRNCSGFYSPTDKTISLDINADAEKHYATFFHEVAHMIDDFNGNGKHDEFFTGFNKNLEVAAIADCNAIAGNALLRGSLNSDLDSLQTGTTRCALIDIIAMASDGKLFRFGKGHNRQYSRSNNSNGVFFNMVAEIFAGLTAAAICEPHNLPIIQTYLPRTLDAFYQTVDAISANPEMDAAYTRLDNGYHHRFSHFIFARHRLNDAAKNLISLVNQFNQDFHAFTKFDVLASCWRDYTSAVNNLRNLANTYQSSIQFANRDIQFAQDFMAKFPQYHKLYPDVYQDIDSVNEECRRFLDATDSAQIDKLIADTWQFILEETFSAPVNALREYSFKIGVYQNLIEGGGIFNGDRFTEGDKITISPKYKLPVVQIGDTPVASDERRLTIISRCGLSLHVKTNKGRQLNLPTQISKSGTEYFYATVISGGKEDLITISPNSTSNIKIDADKNARYISLLEYYVKRCNANCGTDIKLPSYC